MTTVIFGPPSASDPHKSGEIKTPTLTTDRNENETNKFSNWYADYKFLAFVWLSAIKTIIDLAMIFCLFLLAEIQIFAWENKIGKDPIFLHQMHTVSARCIMITSFIAIAQPICTLGSQGFIKLWHKIPWWNCIVILFISCVLGGLFSMLSSIKCVQILVDTIFQQNFSSSVTPTSASNALNQISTSIGEKSFSTKPNSVFYLEHVSVICNIQQIIFLIILIRWKPNNFEWVRYHEKMKQSSSSPFANDQKELSESKN